MGVWGPTLLRVAQSICLSGDLAIYTPTLPDNSSLTKRANFQGKRSSLAETCFTLKSGRRGPFYANNAKGCSGEKSCHLTMQRCRARGSWFLSRESMYNMHRPRHAWETLIISSSFIQSSMLQPSELRSSLRVSIRLIPLESN